MNQNKTNTLQNMYADILTIEDTNSFYKEIDQFTSKLFQVSTTLDQALNESFNKQKKDAFLSILKEQGIEPSDQIKIQELLKKIKEEAKIFPVITIKLGYDPTREHIESFSDWFISRIKRKVILKILVERNLIGGAYITYNGLFKDFSVKKRVQDAFMTKNYTKVARN